MNVHERADGPEDRLSQLGIVLPAGAPSPIGSFANVRQTGSLLFVSGQGPALQSGKLKTGKVGADVTVAQAREDARLVVLNILAAVRAYLGTLDEVAGVIKLTGLVNSNSDFGDHAIIIDAASDLLTDIFGPDGVHARTSFGVGSLPNQITVEIDAILEVAERR